MRTTETLPVFPLVCLASKQGNIELLKMIDDKTDGVEDYFITALTVALENKQDGCVDFLMTMLVGNFECQRKMKNFLLNNPNDTIRNYVMELYKNKLVDTLGEWVIEACEVAIKLEKEIAMDL